MYNEIRLSKSLVLWRDDPLRRQAFPTTSTDVVFAAKWWWAPNSRLLAAAHSKLKYISKEWGSAAEAEIMDWCERRVNGMGRG
jgi:hypothetical protein